MAQTKYEQSCHCDTGQQKALDTKRLYKREVQHNSSNGLGLSIVKETCEKDKMQIKYTFIENIMYLPFVFQDK